MLVLSRRQEETIVIAGEIEIKVLKIKGNTIRLGIQAPHDVKILRGELAPFGVAELTFEVEAESDSELVNPIAKAG